jgi:pyrroline-5-carboxylate reductase
MKMKIGFIGLGNMAKAIIGGILQQNQVERGDIIGSDLSQEAVLAVKEKYGICVCRDNKQVAVEADILFLAVKPQMIEAVIREISYTVKPDVIVVSIAAGKTIDFLQRAFGRSALGKDLGRDDVKLVRCMPNTPALVGEGMTGVCGGDNVTQEDMEIVLGLLQAFGKASVVPERLMDAVVGISGSAPAYVFLFIEAMADEAVAAGMPRQQAYQFAAQTVLGSAKMVLETGKHPGELKDMVCSPGGTTIAAVKVLEEKGFRGVVMDAVEACIEKSKVL